MSSKHEFGPQSTFEYLLTHYRGQFATLFLLPLSVAYNTWFRMRNKIVFLLKSAPTRHEERVGNIVREIDNWKSNGAKEPLCGSRSPWLTMSELVPLYKKHSLKIDLGLRDILSVNEHKQTVTVEPLVNMGQITAQLLPMGWTLPVVPELDDLTVGGLINGFGVETSSHKYGLFQHICESFEIVTAEGKIVRCSTDENPELFFSIPWSHGTLGFLVSAELKMIRATSHVRLRYIPVEGNDRMVQRFTDASRDMSNDFVEMLVYSQEKAVLIIGQMAEKPSDGEKVNRIGRWYKPWFYKHVESFFDKGEGTEYIPLRQYYHRHTRSFFWEMEEIIPFGNDWWYRLLFGWALPPRIALLKFFETDTTRKLREKYHMVQDMLMPISSLKKSLEYFHTKCLLYPLWLCPMRIPANKHHVGFVHPYRLPEGGTDEMFVDIGAYGSPKAIGFDGLSVLRDLEKFVIDNSGYQALYARTSMTEQEFRRMFDHTTYDKLREWPYSQKAFGNVYQKVRARASGSEYKKQKNTMP